MNKVVIVTGGGRGIGAATSILLAKNGYSVCVNYLNRHLLQGRLLTLQVDFNDMQRR